MRAWFACVALVSGCSEKSGSFEGGFHVSCDADAGMAVGPGALCVPLNACLEGCTGDGGCVVGGNLERDPSTGYCHYVPGRGDWCGTPDSLHACIQSGFVDFDRDVPLSDGRPLRIGLYDPIALATDPNTAPLVEDTGSFIQQPAVLYVEPPADGFLVLAVQDPVGTAPPQTALTLRPFAVSAGNIYQVDSYVVSAARAASWNGFTSGAYLAQFFDEKPRPPTNLIISGLNWHPVTGVRVTTSGGAVAYFSTMTMLDATLMATGTPGAAISVGSISSLTAAGGSCAAGACRWQTPTVLPINRGIVFEVLFNCALDPMAVGCQ